MSVGGLPRKGYRSFDEDWGQGVYGLVRLNAPADFPVQGELYGVMIVIESFYSFQFVVLYPGSRIYVRCKSESNGGSSAWIQLVKQ